MTEQEQQAQDLAVAAELLAAAAENAARVMRNATEHFDTLKAHTYTGTVTTYGGGRTWGCSCGAQGATTWRHPGYKAYYVDQQQTAIRRSHLLHVKAEA